MNIVKALLVAAAPLSLATIGPAAPQPALKVAPQATQPVPPPSTFNCIVASNVFTQRLTNPNAKALAERILYFYLGRLDVRTTQQQIKDGLKRSASSLVGANGGVLMNACAHELQDKAQMVQSAAQQLQQGK